MMFVLFPFASAAAETKEGLFPAFTLSQSA